MILSNDQQNALNDVMQFLVDPQMQEMAISGPAGTGKTVLTKFILEAARKQAPMLKLLTGADHQLNTILTSSTNKAAKVLSDATGEEARTIHSVLGLRVVNNFKTGTTSLKRSRDSEVIQNTFIIIDEVSMINKSLLSTIRDLTFKCKVLYIGDAYQLAPVFENTSPVFTEVPHQTKLTSIQRQSANNPIIQFAQQFRDVQDGGDFPEIISYGSEIQLINERDFTYLVDTSFTQPHATNDLRVIAWTNSRVHQYNSYIRGLITSDEAYQIGEYVLTNQPVLGKNGARVLQTDAIAVITDIKEASQDHINGWDVELNGRIAVFQAFNQAEVIAYLNQLKRAKEWPDFFRVKEEFGDLRPIHANTVNKAQGSTYQTTFIDLTDIGKCTKDSHIARLMYTGITRAAKQIYMVGKLPKRLYE